MGMVEATFFSKFWKMRTTLQIDITFDQIQSMVKRLSGQEKIKLSKELEKEVVDSKLTRLLSSFRTKEPDLKTITAEVERARQEIYDKQKR
jgi:hypothetical protein